MLKPVMEKLRIYMLVGGMPKAVDTYCSSENIDQVEKVKRGIIKLYREDIAKYAENYVGEATAIFNAIPSQLSHHDKKIKYSSLEEGDRFTSYKDAIRWIDESMVGNLSIGIDAPNTLGDYLLQPSKLKCYMSDTGLLMTMAAGDHYLGSELYKSFMLGKLSVNQGMMTENLVAQMLTANHHPLRFYEKRITEGSGSRKYEVDFLVKKGGKTVPIEVKSGNSRNHPSLDFFHEKFRKETGKGILLTRGDMRITEQYEFLPLPMAMFL